MGRPCKYDEYVKPYIKQISQWRQDGASVEQIAETLGVALSSFMEYQKKYTELSEALKKSKAVLVADLRGELVRLAFPHDIETIKVYRKKDPETGKITEYSEKTVKKVDGDIAAIHLLLKNIDRDNWADNPQNIRIKEQELELRRQIAEAQNFDFKE